MTNMTLQNKKFCYLCKPPSIVNVGDYRRVDIKVGWGVKGLVQNFVWGPTCNTPLLMLRTWKLR
jgi:hypothetical protein